MENMSKKQMMDATGQAGISIAVDNASFESYFQNITFSNPDDPANQYVACHGIHLISTVDIGTSDSNDNGEIDYFTTNIGVINHNTMLEIKCPDLLFTTQMTVSTIDFCGTSLGSIDFSNIALSSLSLTTGPGQTTGIQYEIGRAFHVDGVSYTYNQGNSLVISNIGFVESFSGSTSDPSSWNPSGTFNIGDISGGNPATINIGSSGDRNYIAMNLPMQGSLRIGNMNCAGTDLGTLAAIDGINVIKLYIELPGRGIGRP
jgi:hypothetical protein